MLMWAGRVSLDTMRPTTNSPGAYTPAPVYHPRTTLLAGVVVVVAVLAALVAVEHPFAALGAVALAVVARPLARRAVRLRDARRRQGRARRYSLPATDVSFEL